MSGTASSDVFSGDPSKKFDVIFSIDMRQLLTGVGMKPADIERIMATAAANSKKGLPRAPSIPSLRSPTSRRRYAAMAVDDAAVAAVGGARTAAALGTAGARTGRTSRTGRTRRFWQPVRRKTGRRCRDLRQKMQTATRR